MFKYLLNFQLNYQEQKREQIEFIGWAELHKLNHWNESHERVPCIHPANLAGGIFWMDRGRQML